tara:strand:- start:51 stop:299 length:249 start_codon:yes stop_codon:yes gene_type:complete
MELKCVKCKEGIHPLRIKALPNTKVCVSCSTSGTYKAITTVGGSGDHTWNDIQIMTSDQYEVYSKNIKEIDAVGDLSPTLEE